MDASKDKEPTTPVTDLASVEPKALVIAGNKPNVSLHKTEPTAIAVPATNDSYLADFNAAQENLKAHVSASTSGLFYIETDSRLFGEIKLDLLIRDDNNTIVINVDNFSHHTSAEHVLRDVAGRFYKHGVYRYKYESIHDSRKIADQKNRNAISRFSRSLSRMFFKTKDKNIFEEYDKRYELDRASIEGSSSTYKATQGTQVADKFQLGVQGKVSGGIGGKFESTTPAQAADSKDNKDGKTSNKLESNHGIQGELAGSRTTEVTETTTSNLESVGQLPPRHALQIADTINIFLSSFNKHYPEIKTVFLFEGSLALHQNQTFIQAISQISVTKNSYIVTKVPLPAPPSLASATRLAVFHGPPTRIHQLRSFATKHRRVMFSSALSLILLSVVTTIGFVGWRRSPPPTPPAVSAPVPNQPRVDEPPITPPQTQAPVQAIKPKLSGQREPVPSKPSTVPAKGKHPPNQAPKKPLVNAVTAKPPIANGAH